MKNFVMPSLFFFATLILVACSSKNESPTPVPSRTEAQNRAAYSLDWKINEGEVVAYKTAMNSIANSTVSININELFGEIGIPDELTQQLSGLKFPEVSSMISILQRNPRGNISVKMIVDQIEMPENQPDNSINEGFGQLFQKMEGTVQLRGELTPDGEIASFYLEKGQRNLLAMLFELPTVPVQVGDSWEIDVNCITMGNGYIATKAQKASRVEFTELSATPDGRPVAVLTYAIAETVEGDFLNPLSTETESIPTSMTCSFLGQGRFLIEEGRWEQLTGEFAVTSTGRVMQADMVQQMALTPLEEVPAEYLVLP